MSLLQSRVAVATAVALGALAIACSVEARVTKIEISSKTSAFSGATFGNVGAYEQIKGIATGELDPADRRNAVITDIQSAPRNANGKVSYRTSFTLLKPVDMTKASGLMVFEVVNRGNHLIPGTLTIGTDPGDGFLYRTGDVLLWSGWQGDIPQASVSAAQEWIEVPVAKNADGTSITGPVFQRFINIPLAGTPAARQNTQSLQGSVLNGQIYGRAPASLDTTQAKLISFSFETQSGQRTNEATVASTDWAFADCRTTAFPGTPDPTRICLKNGFDPNLGYMLVYTAKDPLVLGVGMAAMRDVNAFFHRAAADDAGTANPVAGNITKVMSYGISQSGRFLKNYLALGFNEDESGKIVWDGADADIAGQMGQFNIRFAVQGNISNLYEPGAEGPLWWSDYNDVTRGRGTTSILQRCNATGTCPKIMETYGGPEMWYSRGSVGIAGTKGTEALPVPDNVRRYYFPSTTHGGGGGGFTRDSTVPNGQVLYANPNPERESLRALYVALRDWTMKGTTPPPSQYPNVTDGTLVRANSTAMGWPAIPGWVTPDGVINSVLDYDLGPAFRYNDESGVISNEPPPVKQVINTPAPKVDSDGNEIAGVRSLLLRMPLGTYTGWNQVNAGALRGQEPSLAGGYIPFARTKAERTVLVFTAKMNGANETPPNSSTQTGDFTLYLYGDGTVNCSATTTFAPGAITASHIHQAASGVAGPIIVPFTVDGSRVFCPTGSKMTDDQITALKAGNTYANVHSAAFPGGEIRGQIVPANPASVVDPRPSIAERYTSLWGYYYGITQNANDLVSQRLLLPEDANRLVNQALNDMLRTSLLPKRGDFIPGFEPKAIDIDESDHNAVLRFLHESALAPLPSSESNTTVMPLSRVER